MKRTREHTQYFHEAVAASSLLSLSPPLSPPLSSPRAPFLSEVLQLFVFLAFISSLRELSHTHSSSLYLTHTLSLLLFFATLYSLYSTLFLLLFFHSPEQYHRNQSRDEITETKSPIQNHGS